MGFFLSHNTDKTVLSIREGLKMTLTIFGISLGSKETPKCHFTGSVV